MYTISDEIEEYVSNNRIDYQKLADSSLDNCLSKMSITFCEKQCKSNFLWECFSDDIAIQMQDPFAVLKKCEIMESCYLIIEDFFNKSGFIFQNFADAVRALEHCTSCVFYIVDVNMSSIICFNDHDMLIGAGEAKKLITILPK